MRYKKLEKKEIDHPEFEQDDDSPDITDIEGRAVSNSNGNNRNYSRRIPKASQSLDCLMPQKQIGKKFLIGKWEKTHFWA